MTDFTNQVIYNLKTSIKPYATRVLPKNKKKKIGRKAQKEPLGSIFIFFVFYLIFGIARAFIHKGLDILKTTNFLL
ncbi:hypothetical protein [Rodentibacter caecimuris]|uniref:hypothetical protein n=1 Tax=Rodentibacter caecimuris TaxID=1796644 RepID=UPI00211A5C22|nr:hypothetical protein [Rodentibacter heylii]MCQ9124706.1 hypothetical protein [Rodentibacter heylii]MCX2962304.1 hypothetical protein [Rodentibacter heylii]